VPWSVREVIVVTSMTARPFAGDGRGMRDAARDSSRRPMMDGLSCWYRLPLHAVPDADASDVLRDAEWRQSSIGRRHAALPGGGPFDVSRPHEAGSGPRSRRRALFHLRMREAGPTTSRQGVPRSRVPIRPILG
jgi:hypothetical protein